MQVFAVELCSVTVNENSYMFVKAQLLLDIHHRSWQPKAPMTHRENMRPQSRKCQARQHHLPEERRLTSPGQGEEANRAAENETTQTRIVAQTRSLHRQ
jgi:hypothetical protein